MCIVVSLRLLYVMFLILRRIQQDIIVNLHILFIYIYIFFYIYLLYYIDHMHGDQ
jgi:hypothetical protein